MNILSVREDTEECIPASHSLEQTIEVNEKLYDAITEIHDELVEKAKNYDFSKKEVHTKKTTHCPNCNSR